jgi:hypothetical protein
MPINTKMPNGLVQFYQTELLQATIARNQNNLAAEWNHLERAHILAQAYPMQHTYVHWLMLKFGIRIKSSKEILGQIPRLLVGGVKSFVGVIPVGNTGGANVPPLRSMEIPQDLKMILNNRNGA